MQQVALQLIYLLMYFLCFYFLTYLFIVIMSHETKPHTYYVAGVGTDFIFQVSPTKFWNCRFAK